MASAPADPSPIVGRVDANGRLVEADPKLERLQIEAGSKIGACLALPQLANVARLAHRLQIPVSRRVLAAGREQDIDMWVRAVPDGGEVALKIEQWSARPAPAARLSAIAAVEHERLSAEPLAWAVDEQLRLVEVAPALAEILGPEASSAGGEPLTKLVRLEDSEDGTMPLLDALASRSGFSGQRVTVRNTGHELVLSGELTLGPDGGFGGFEGSAAAAGEEPLVRSRPAIDSAIHAALRSPLANIVRSAEEMIERPEEAGPANYADYASDIASAARHLMSVVRSLGEQPERGGPVRVDVSALVGEAVALLESTARERGVVIGVERGNGLFARGDVRSVIQVLVNLLANALRHSPEATAITVSYERASGRVMVHVADEGPGIDPADHDRIFEPFQKGSDSGEGSGLGLAIARRLARGMGGDIRLDSTPGKGARFSLDLPAA